MGRQLRTNLPLIDKQLVPRWPYLKAFWQQDQQFKQQQKSDSDQRHRRRPQPNIVDDMDVWITRLTSRPLYQLVSAHADAIGCSSKGRQNTTGMVMAEMSEEWKCDTYKHKPKTLSQLLVDNFSFEKLYCIMARNGCQTLGLFDDMSSFYARLDLFKHTGITLISAIYILALYSFKTIIIMWLLHGTDTTVGSEFDKKTVITKWGRIMGTKSYSVTLPRTCFNVTGQHIIFTKNWYDIYIVPGYISWQVLSSQLLWIAWRWNTRMDLWTASSLTSLLNETCM